MIMPADEVVRASLTGGCMRACLFSAGSQVMSGRAGRGLGVAALVSWLLAESLGAYMFRSWLTIAGLRRGTGDAKDTMSPALVLGHAGLALAGLVSWVSFLASGLAVLAWLAVGLLAPAIGLGISTVTVWTPYPVSQPQQDPSSSAERPSGESPPTILVTNEILDRTLADEALASELVDELVERMLAEPPTAKPIISRRWQLAPLIPILHGILALATFLLAVLAAIAAGT